jgi:hypothetical protein
MKERKRRRRESAAVDSPSSGTPAQESPDEFSALPFLEQADIWLGTKLLPPEREQLAPVFRMAYGLQSRFRQFEELHGDQRLASRLLAIELTHGSLYRDSIACGDERLPKWLQDGNGEILAFARQCRAAIDECRTPVLLVEAETDGVSAHREALEFLESLLDAIRRAEKRAGYAKADSQSHFVDALRNGVANRVGPIDLLDVLGRMLKEATRAAKAAPVARRDPSPRPLQTLIDAILRGPEGEGAVTFNINPGGDGDSRTSHSATEPGSDKAGKERHHHEWLRDPGESPPNEFLTGEDGHRREIGFLRDNQRALGWAIAKARGRDVTIDQEKLERHLHALAKRSTVWVRQCEGQIVECFFKDKKLFHDTRGWLDEFRSVRDKNKTQKGHKRTKADT